MLLRTLSIINYVVLSIGLTINCGFLIVFLRSRRLRKLPTNRLICSLLLSDFLIEAGITSTLIICNPPDVASKISGIITDFAMTLTVFNLCMIWVDRVLAIKRSFNYHRLITHQSTATMLAIAWLSGTILAIISTIVMFTQVPVIQVRFKLITPIIAISGFALLCVANVLIFKEVRTQLHKIRLHQPRRGSSGVVRSRRSAYICVLVVTSFLVCWLPYVMERMNFLINASWMRQSWFSRLSTLMISCNTLANPCFYILMNRDLRKTLRRQLKRSLRRMTYSTSHGPRRPPIAVINIRMNSL